MLKLNYREYDISGWAYYYDDKGNPIFQKVIIHVRFDSIKSIEPANSGYRSRKLIDLGDNLVIFPGLIDLHTHYEYNTIPIWNRPYEAAWDNRHEWRMHSDYNKNIKNLYKKLLEEWSKLCASKTDDAVTAKRKFLFLSELQALSGGTTVLQEPFHIDEDASMDMPHTLLRSTGVASDLGVNDKTYSVVDFFKPNVEIQDIKPPYDTKDWIPQWTKEFEAFLKNLNDTKAEVNAYLVHLAEGRAGYNNSQASVDPYSRKETDHLMQQLTIKNADDIRKMRLTLIHGCGMDLAGYAEQIKDFNINFVWSPVSNLLLYDDTPAFYSYYKNGVIEKMCIGSDWSPSGSKHVWDEAKFAYQYLVHRHASDHQSVREIAEDVLKMCTVYPASIINAEKIGNIKEGGFADFFIVDLGKRDPKETTGDVAIKLLKATDANTKAVVVGGQIVYGENSMFNAFGHAGELLPEQEQVQVQSLDSKKAVYPMEVTELGTTVEKMITDLERIFKSYSKDIEKSKLLSSTDIKYQNKISELRKRFCGG